MAKERFITTVNGIFLGNVYDPLNLEIPWPEGHRNESESEYDARARYVRWIATKTVGPPMASPEYEEADLRSHGLIGIYFNEKNGDTYCSAEEVSLSFPGGLTDVEFLGRNAYRIFKAREND